MGEQSSATGCFLEAGGLMSYGTSTARGVSAARRLRRPHSQGRQPGRLAGRVVDQVRVCNQSSDRQGARPRNSFRAARARRWGDRI